MKKVYLTPEDQLKLDPRGISRALMTRFTDKISVTPLPHYLKRSPSEIFERYKAKVLGGVNGHTPYTTYNEEMYSKYSRQGGLCTFKMLEENIAKYYEHADYVPIIDDRLIMARDYLIRLITQKIEMHDIPKIPETPYYDTYAGIPSGRHKGTYQAETELMSPWRHMLPPVPSVRNMRGSWRVIFMDSNTNVRYIEQQCAAVRHWLRSYLPEFFSAWKNPYEDMNNRITDSLYKGYTFIELDYKKMDQHFSLGVVQTLILPIYEVLLESSLSFMAAVEEYFNVPLYMGEFLITGLHNLFSGQVITNDFETIYTVILALAAVLTDRIQKPLILAQGDDMVLGAKISLEEAIKIKDRLTEISNLAGLEIHMDEKTRVVRDEVRFCRKVYYPKGKRTKGGMLIGAYPSVLALNNIVQPEYLSKDDSDAVIATLQRMDNLAGSPDFYNFAQFVSSELTIDLKHVNKQSLSKYPVDWWARLYGESWTPDNSPTYKFVNNEPNK